MPYMSTQCALGAAPHSPPLPDLKMTEAFYVAGELSCLHNFIYLLDAWWIDF